MKKILLLLRNILQCAVDKLNKYLDEPQTLFVIPPEKHVEPLEVNAPSVENVSIGTEVVVTDEETVVNSTMVSNEEFLSLCRRLAEMVKQYDMMAKQMPDGEAKDLLDDMSEQIISSMVLGGCQAITQETKFDAIRHRPVPYAVVEDGSPIQSTIRVGVSINGQVLIPAVVLL